MGVKHTPGPWYAVAEIPEHGEFESGPPPQYVISVCEDDIADYVAWCGDRETAEADAQLMAAAPDMLTTLRAAEKWFSELGDGYGTQGLLDDIRNAIAKAEGRTVGT